MVQLRNDTSHKELPLSQKGGHWIQWELLRCIVRMNPLSATLWRKNRNWVLAFFFKYLLLLGVCAMACVQVRGQLHNTGKHLYPPSHLPSTYVIFDATSRTARARDNTHNKFCVKANKASNDRSWCILRLGTSPGISGTSRANMDDCDDNNTRSLHFLLPFHRLGAMPRRLGQLAQELLGIHLTLPPILPTSGL